MTDTIETRSQFERKSCDQIAKALGECYLLDALPFLQGFELIDAMRAYNEEEKHAIRLEYLTVCHDLRHMRTGVLFDRFQYVKGLVEKYPDVRGHKELLEAIEDEIERRDRRLGI